MELSEPELLRKQNKRLREECQSLKTQLDEAVKFSENVQTLCEENATLSKTNRSLQSQTDEVQKRLEISLHLNEELQQTTEKLEKRLLDSNDYITKLKRRVENVMSRNADLEKQLKRTREKFAEEFQAAKEQHVQQIRNLKTLQKAEIANFEKSLECKALELKQLTDALDESRAEHQKLVESQNLVESEKRQLVQVIASHREQLERERNVAANRIQAMSIMLDMKSQNQVDDLLAKFDEEKRKIYHFASDLFREFFDPRRSLNEESFRQILTSAKEALVQNQREVAAVKRIVGASGLETADAAVARVLMSKPEHYKRS